MAGLAPEAGRGGEGVTFLHSSQKSPDDRRACLCVGAYVCVLCAACGVRRFASGAPGRAVAVIVERTRRRLRLFARLSLCINAHHLNARAPLNAPKSLLENAAMGEG